MPNYLQQYGLGVVIALVDDFTKPASRIGRAFDRVRSEVAKTKEAMKQFRETSRMGLEVMAAGAAMAAPMILVTKSANDAHQAVHDYASLFVLGGTVENAIKQGAHLGEAIRNIVIAEPIEHEMEDIREAAYNLQSALGNLELTEAGLKPMLDLATAAKGTPIEAGDVIKSVLEQYKRVWESEGMAAADMTKRAADVTAAAVSTFATTLGPLQEGLKEALPYAANLRMSYAETVAAVGQLQTKGLPGSRGGTAMAAFLRGVIRLTDKDGKKIETANLTMRELLDTMSKVTAEGGKVSSGLKGLEIEDETGKFIGLVPLIKEIEKLFGLSSDAIKSQSEELTKAGVAIEDVAPKFMTMGNMASIIEEFGEEGAKAGLMLVGFADELERKIELVKEEDAATRMANVRREGAVLMWKALRNQIKMVTEEIGLRFVSQQKDLIKSIRGIVVTVRDWIVANPDLVRTIGLTSLAIGGLTVAIGAAIIAWAAINAAFVSTPVGWIVIALAAIAASIYLVIKNWDKLKSTAQLFMVWLRGVLRNVPDWLLVFVPPLMIVKHWEQVKEILGLLWELVKIGWQEIKPILDQIGGAFEIAFSAVVDAITWAWDKIKDLPIWGWVGSVLDFASDAGGKFLDLNKHALSAVVGRESYPEAALSMMNTLGMIGSPSVPMPQPAPLMPPNTVQDNRSVNATVNVNASPGMNEEQLAEEVVKKIRDMERMMGYVSLRGTI